MAGVIVEDQRANGLIAVVEGDGCVARDGAAESDDSTNAVGFSGVEVWAGPDPIAGGGPVAAAGQVPRSAECGYHDVDKAVSANGADRKRRAVDGARVDRSEERRVGKECRS